ncbi:MAG: copper amine oxidase N-terminal domain-containing protein [Defluviitaleaceae bacterium]|nr:copper amine oxidase N-terminal domain-containing protein [Defluviitaleaceae bacterium]
MKNKKLIALSLATTLVITNVVSIPTYAAENTTGTQITFPNAVIVDGLELLPLRDTMEELGFPGTIQWNEELSKIIVTQEHGEFSRQATFFIGNTVVNIVPIIGDERNVTLLAPPVIIGGSTHITPEFFSNFLDISMDTFLQLFNAPQRIDPFNLQIMGEDNPERNAMWVADLEEFRTAAFTSHPKFVDSRVNQTAENLRLREQFDESITELIQDVSNLTDLQIIFSMQRLVSQFNDNHFGVLPSWITEPVTSAEFRWFDGVYLIRTLPEFAHVLNERLTHINDTPLEEILPRLKDTISSETPLGQLNVAARRISNVVVLYYLGFYDGREVTFTFENGQSITLDQNHETTRSDFNDILVQNRLIDIPLSEMSQNSHTFIEEYGILHINLEQWMPSFFTNEVGEPHYIGDTVFAMPEGYTIEQLLEETEADPTLRLWRANPAITNILENYELNAILFDVRENPGGNTGFAIPLIETLFERAETLDEGMLFYAISPRSASASRIGGQIFEALGAVIIGEPLDQRAIFYSQATDHPGLPPLNYTLTNSQIWFMVPNSLVDLTNPTSDDAQGFGYTPEMAQSIVVEFETLNPHVLIPYRIEHWANNVDPVLEHIKALIRATQ